jgi:hypothetical protein
MDLFNHGKKDGICSSMASVFFGPNLLLRALCEAENSFTEALFRSLLNDLIFAYIVDFSFKMEFSREYTRMYESVLTSVGKKKRSLQGKALVSFFVGFFFFFLKKRKIFVKTLAFRSSPTLSSQRPS